LSAGDLVINLTTQTESTDLVEWCLTAGIHYIDTANGHWANRIVDNRLGSQYFQNQKIKDLKTRFRYGVSGLVNHGMNPGLISSIARSLISDYGSDLKKILVTEIDTQISSPVSSDVFCNTWSPFGLYEEYHLDAEEFCLLPEKSAVGYRATAGGGQLSREAWTPSAGTYRGFVIPHREVITLAELFPAERCPEISFVYSPCPAARAFLETGARPDRTHLLTTDIVSGYNEVGILAQLTNGNKVWRGYRLDIGKARHLDPDSNATIIPVVAGLFAGLTSLLENPSAGLLEPEDLAWDRVLQTASRFLGPVTEARPMTIRPDTFSLS
jgi:homospermidine synthase